jgi:transposase
VPAPVVETGRHRCRAHRGVTSDERAELVRLRRELRVAQMEIEILKRASAYFARENVLPK